MNFDLALKYSRKLQKETFFTNPLFIMQNCFVKNNLVFENQKIQNQYPLLVFSTIYTNIPNHIIGTGFDEDLSIIKKKYFVDKIDNLGLEFIYSTNDWITLEGKSFRSIRKNINKFQKEHNIKVLFEYPKEKIINFLNYWAQDKRQKNVSDLTKELFEHELKESIKNLELVRNINYKAIYLEENGTLIGFCIFFNYYDSFWIALMQKTKLGIRGDRKSTRLNSSHIPLSRMPSSA